jgi:two-component system response regulator FixJ
MAAGVLDYFGWPCPPTELGEIVVGLIIQAERRASIDARKTHARELVDRLSEGELDILRCLLAGASFRQIAAELGSSRRTAELSGAHILARLEARSVSDAVRIGIYAGLAEAERGLARTAARHAGGSDRALVGR